MLYIMRHGKTDWNEKHKLQGRTDIPLNEMGKDMARDASIKYGDVHFDICFCSPLSRAYETAKIFLNDKNVEIVLDERLVEMSFGIYEGLENSFQISDCPINPLFQDPVKYKGAEGAETFDDLFERTGNFLRERVVPRLEKDENVLIMGHGVINSCIICQMRKLPIEQFWEAGIDNCKLISV